MELCYPSKIYTMAISMTIPFCILNYQNQRIDKGLHIQPKGNYLRAFCKGDWSKIPTRYEEILAYAEQHYLQFSGFAYEKGLNELVIDTFDDYITQIEIPVQTE